MISSWPARTREVTASPLASARSVRLTLSLREIDVSDSAPLTVYHLSAVMSDGEASASRASNFAPVPEGTFSWKSAYFTGVVQRRSSGLSA